MQSLLQNEITEGAADLAAAQAYARGATMQQNLHHIQTVELEHPSQELVAARTCLEDLRNELQKARDQMVCALRYSNCWIAVSGATIRIGAG